MRRLYPRRCPNIHPSSLIPHPYLPSMSKESLFALSLFPYLAFLWFLTRSGKTPKLALVGFYMLLVFVAVTIPAGIYAKVAYKDQLANIDWLHGAAEFFSYAVEYPGCDRISTSYPR